MAKVMVFSLKNWFIHSLWEKLIAKHLELNGNEVINVVYTKALGGNDLRSYGEYDHIHELISIKTSEETSKYFNITKTVPIEDYFNQGDLQNALKIIEGSNYIEKKTLMYKGIDLGKMCRTSTVRTVHSIDESDELYQKVFSDNVSTSIYLVDAFERILTQEKPDVVFTVNGIFFAERILVEMCNRLGIKCVTYERAARPDHLYIASGEPINTFNFDNRYNKMYKDKALNETELKEITEYLNDRRTSKNTTQKFQDSDTDDLQRTKELMHYDAIKDKHIVSLFTNVMWDTAAVDKDTIFKDVLDWCVKSIEYAKNNDNIEMFIRIHPADARYWNFPGAKQLQDEITKAIELPCNVHLIRSNEKVNSYCLAELSNACVTYTSQIGGEIAAMGKPLIIAGEAFYRDKGFGYAPESQEEYYARISDPLLEGHKEEALKYEHFLYFKMHYPLHLIKENASKGMGVIDSLGFVEMKDNTMYVNLPIIKNDPELQKIADYILEGIADEYDVKEYVVQ